MRENVEEGKRRNRRLSSQNLNGDRTKGRDRKGKHGRGVRKLTKLK